jgi:sugar phosphate isomerase/epimerase
MRLSLSGFLFEDDYEHQSVNYETFISTARESGYMGVELRQTQVSPKMGAEVLEAYRSIANAAGLTVTCIAPRLPNDGTGRQECFLGYLDVAERLGCRVMKVNGDIAWLKDAAAVADSRGVDLAVNTHICSPTETVSGALALVRAVDRPNFGLLYDCMHLMLSGEDYVGSIDLLYPHIRGVLVQCVRRAASPGNAAIAHRGRWYEKARIDQPGVQNWSAVIQALRRHGYDGWFTVIENGWPKDQRKQIAAHTAEGLRELGKRVL